MKQMVKMKARVGISPILATVIIIAVTLVIAIGVIGWIMGIWGGFGSTESLQIYPDSFINTTYTNNEDTLILHIRNTGTATAQIDKVEIAGVGQGTLYTDNASISPGQDARVYVKFADGTFTAGATYQVKIYTAAGNVYTAVVKAE